VLDDWFRQRLGLRPGEVWDYVVARTTIEYRSELTQTDLHAVGRATLVKLGRTSVTVKISLEAADGRLAAKVGTVAVAVDAASRRPRMVTAAERAALAGAR
jgi:acyl-CoA thioesterase FadM